MVIHDLQSFALTGSILSTTTTITTTTYLQFEDKSSEEIKPPI